MKQKKHIVKEFTIIEVIILMVISSLISALTTGIVIFNNNRSSSGTTYSSLLQDSNVKDFLNVYASVMDEYYENIDKKAAIDSAINGMMSYLGDKYTTYLDSSDTNALTSKLAGEYSGIGVSLGDNNTILDVFDDSPAQNIGIQVNDIIVKVNDDDVSQKSSSEISSLIKNCNTDSIKLTISRNGELFEYTVKIDNLYIPAITTKTLDANNKKVGYIYISTFSSSLSAQMEKALNKLESNNIDSLIIDLRGNGGGYLSAATDTANLFLENGKTIYSLETKEGINTTKDVTDTMRKYPIVILINNGSASASEILTAALKESYGAILVGKKTYGKGKVQQTYQLDDGSMVKYTSARWLTPNGDCIDEKGIDPDYDVDLLYNKDSNGNIIDYQDTQLNKALEIITK